MSEENEKKIIELLEKIEENTRKPVIEKPDMSKKPFPSEFDDKNISHTVRDRSSIKDVKPAIGFIKPDSMEDTCEKANENNASLASNIANILRERGLTLNHTFTEPPNAERLDHIFELVLGMLRTY